jgi:hypothetical protein
VYGHIWKTSTPAQQAPGGLGATAAQANMGCFRVRLHLSRRCGAIRRGLLYSTPAYFDGENVTKTVDVTSWVRSVPDPAGYARRYTQWFGRAEATMFYNGQLMRHHTTKLCFPPCPLHSPTDHSMRGMPLSYRVDRGIFERTCPCGIGHPDPDDPLVRHGADSGVHGCCGCCHPNLTEENSSG